ncbi:MAG: 30S ribosome-binding factor RbfA [Candidatus Portnoybacteria bacterium]|nr:30S ribosome-binding factor RbfA [Candidatus Portnoybacteria bacterium]
MPSQRRMARLNESISRILGEIIHEEISRSDVLISITEVNISPDVQWVDVWVSIFPYGKHAEMMEALQRKLGIFQSLFNHRLRIRHTPKIRFTLDSRLEAGVVDEGMPPH